MQFWHTGLSVNFNPIMNLLLFDDDDDDGRLSVDVVTSSATSGLSCHHGPDLHGYVTSLSVEGVAVIDVAGCCCQLLMLLLQLLLMSLLLLLLLQLSSPCSSSSTLCTGCTYVAPKNLICFGLPPLFLSKRVWRDVREHVAGYLSVRSYFMRP